MLKYYDSPPHEEGKWENVIGSLSPALHKIHFDFFRFLCLFVAIPLLVPPGLHAQSSQESIGREAGLAAHRRDQDINQRHGPSSLLRQNGRGHRRRHPTPHPGRAIATSARPAVSAQAGCWVLLGALPGRTAPSAMSHSDRKYGPSGYRPPRRDGPDQCC